ncbi:hypothetical protein PGT21_010172 [Puccinia graminis f. sp. tritici]|uniref:DUF6589 domain-containing protein n=1 Tax=Puccinia graminis f. sp. tritici TaxID=56615 RepID=A0A5B0LS59_PUCGR|nr:hypothetical protein PGTUg99_029899 [Puccinia graminis f. sp. tritici]KAA1071509.1 hypothetical protein PGT21_010172 [Puccinia graminis f. sp. tritici]
MLISSPEDEKHWVLVLKSQIAKVLLTYIAKPAEKRTTIAITPPTIEQISHKPPDITMIKLMIASDNSAQGIGEVCTGIIQQSNLDETEFSSRLQVMDGDLATCANIQSLQSQRVPSEYSADTITNLLTLLGGSHTLWNIGLAIFELHYGNTSDSRDCGAWRWLDSLGIPSTKTLDKKDFTKMIQNMEKIHEATIVYCIMCVMGIQNSSLTDQLLSLPGKTIESIIDKTYHQYFSARAKSKAAKSASPKHSNLLLRLGDFASIIEGNRAMKSGDIGRLMNMWKRWSVIAIGVTKLRQYAIQLPRMIILLNHVLPAGLSKIIRHSLLIAPSGRQRHFVAKDYFLEHQNCWLKYIFNQTGRGTEIDRLKDLYSTNVQTMLIQKLATDSGAVHIFYSHHNKIDLKSMNNCLRMTRANNVCGPSDKAGD